MGQRAKTKNNAIPIYRSRQAGRTDIEELLGPAFNPSQRSTGDPPEIVRLPRPEDCSDQPNQQSVNTVPEQPLSTVGAGAVGTLHITEQDAVTDSNTCLLAVMTRSSLAADHSSLSTVPTDSLDNSP